MKKPKEERKPFPKLLYVVIALICVIGLLIGFVYLLTANKIIDSEWLSSKGTIGDAINGMTAPIITLISAGLIFYSFLAQIEANRTQSESNKMIQAQWEFDTYYKLYNAIVEAFENNLFATARMPGGLGSGGGIVTKEYKGVGYLMYVANRARAKNINDVKEYLIEIRFIVEDLIFLLEYLDNSKISHKKYLTDKLIRFYNAFLKNGLIEIAGSLSMIQETDIDFLKKHSDLQQAIKKERKYE
ncbi:MAG: hypothetical protein Q8R82_14270 [Hyphomonadaceae bacterium]|nr:hypothetical protein [Hyphomonadaceae bacterium]